MTMIPWRAIRRPQPAVRIILVDDHFSQECHTGDLWPGKGACVIRPEILSTCESDLPLSTQGFDDEANASGKLQEKI